MTTPSKQSWEYAQTNLNLKYSELCLRYYIRIQHLLSQVFSQLKALYYYRCLWNRSSRGLVDMGAGLVMKFKVRIPKRSVVELGRASWENAEAFFLWNRRFSIETRPIRQKLVVQHNSCFLWLFYFYSSNNEPLAKECRAVSFTTV